jgi:uncharacterized protein YlxW (UPF0749 family)
VRIVPDQRPDLWQVLVPVVALAAGLMLATASTTARGTDLRSAGRTSLADLIRSTNDRITNDGNTVEQLQRDVAGATDLLAQSDLVVAQLRNRAKPLEEPAGLVSMTGPGLTVTLDDSHVSVTDPNIDRNALVVHQSDVQAAVNALWAGGAEAMSIMDERVTFTSAVRCVGNTLLLNGRVFSPPFQIAAIGPSGPMREKLDGSPGLKLFRRDASSYGLGYRVEDSTKITVPAYSAPIGLTYAEVGKQ